MDRVIAGASFRSRRLGARPALPGAFLVERQEEAPAEAAPAGMEAQEWGRVAVAEAGVTRAQTEP